MRKTITKAGMPLLYVLCFYVLLPPMLIDCHVHVSALLPEHGLMSARILKSFPFRFMQHRLGIQHTDGQDAITERSLTLRLFQLLEETADLDAAAVLAFDAVYTRDGEYDARRTHLY